MKRISSRIARSLAAVLAMGLIGLPQQAVADGAAPSVHANAPATADLVIPNGGFEEELVDEAIPSWLLGQGGWDAFSRDTSVSTEGKASIRLVDLDGASRHSIVSSRVPVEPETAYVVSADLYKRQGGIVMYARYYDSNNQQITSQGANFFSTQADVWQGITLNVTTPEDTAYLAVELYVGTIEVDVNIDNVLLTTPEDSGPFELIQNPSFELPSGPGGVLPYWELTYGSWNNITRDTSTSSDGDASVRIYNPTSEGRYGIRSGKMLIEPGTSYLLKADINRTVAGVAAYIRYYDDAGVQVESYGANFFNTLAGSWEPLYLSGRAPESATTLAVEFYIGHSEVDVNIDNIQVVLDPRADIVTRTFPVPLVALETHAGDIAKMPDGTYRTWIVSGGNEEAFLYEIDTLTKEVLNEWQLPNVARSYYARVDDSGTVWASAFNSGGGARLFMLPFGADEPIDVGRFSGDGRILYQFDVGDDGAVYVGSYEGMASGPLPPARVGKYDPTTDTWEDFGILDPALTYINTVSVVGDYAYAGAGTEWAGFYKVHTQTGTKEALQIPPQVTDCARVYESDAVGELIFVRFSNCEGVPSKGWVYDTANDEWVAEIPGFQGQFVSDASPDGLVYLIASNHLSTFNLDTYEITQLYRIQRESGARGIIDIDDSGLIVGFTGDGYQWSYDINSGESTFDRIEGLYQSRIAPHAMAEGPDGRIYVTGYFQGGVAAYDPRDDSFTFWEFPPQAERIVSHDGKLYLGTYTGGELWEFDPSEDWELWENPRRVVDLRGLAQDRPFGIASTGDYVAMGTVPDYGKLGGVLALYDPVTEDVDTYENLIPDHSIVALTHEKGILYGATSVWGGLGSTPAHDNARVFAFDVETRELLWSVEPYPGERAFTGLTVDEFGNLWVVSPGKVLKLDKQGNLLDDTTIVSYDWSSPSAVWFGGAIEYDPVEQRIYGTTSRTLFSLDPHTLENNAFGVNGEYLVLHTDGTRYYTIGYELIQERSLSREYLPLSRVNNVVFEDEPGTDNDRIIIPPGEGVQYWIDGVAVPVGAHPASGLVEVTITALPSYVIPNGAKRVWTYEFSIQDESTPPDDDDNGDSNGDDNGTDDPPGSDDAGNDDGRPGRDGGTGDDTTGDGGSNNSSGAGEGTGDGLSNTGTNQGVVVLMVVALLLAGAVAWAATRQREKI